MDQKELYKYIGSLQQMAYIRPVTCEEGRARGMRLYDVKNEYLQYQVMCDKCLDISGLSYKGINMSFLSKPGLQGRNQYDTNGLEALRSIMGGLFFTAGFENICAPYENETGSYPMHGRMRTTPAEQLCAEIVREGDHLKLRIRGTMREAELFGENLVLRRTIESVYGEKTITLTDEIENEAFRPEPLMLLYHINLGYPFLTPQLKLYIPTASVTARDAASAGHEDAYDRMDPPKENEPEYVFIHDMRTDETGKSRVLAVNEALQLGLKIEYTTENLPYFMEWKSTAAGDYVIGLEPSNSSVYGRAHHEARGDLHRIGPFEKETNQITFTVLDGEDEIQTQIDLFKKVFGYS